MIKTKKISIFIVLLALLFSASASANKYTARVTIVGQKLDPKVVAEWRKAGALVGWLAQAPNGGWHYLRARPGSIDSTPAFVWRKFKPGVLMKLPSPSVPFAIGFGNTSINNRGLKELSRFQNLQSLDLSHTRVTDSGLKHLDAIKSLRSLDLGASSVTDKGLKALAKIKHLRKLYFGSTAVTDAGLKELAGLRGLKILYLYKTKVTDAGLKELVVLKHLRFLVLVKTQVTVKGVAKLSKALPQLRIIR